MKRKKTAQPYLKASVSQTKRVKSHKISPLITPLVATACRPHTGNLPVPLTPFVGRQAEVEEISGLVCSPAVRLVTLYGTAGIGKTRLSLAVGEKLQNHFRDGVYFVNLAPVRTTEPGLAAIAQALGLQDQRQLAPLEKLQNYLQGRSLLLILDNFEQTSALGPAIGELLAGAPQLKVIVTSREVLHLYGEYVYSVPPLQLLELNEAISFETLCQNEAIRLFCQRASMVNPQFELTREIAGTVAHLCIHLEGLPLAIELAAARCDVFSPATLLERLQAGKRLELLVGGFSNLPLRQQTLAEALEWSYELLSEPEKQLFRKLSVFAGGFSLAAAVAMNGAETSTLDTLISLLNKSLLKQVKGTPGEELRFTMLETIREFALEKLVEAGEQSLCRAAHSRYFTEMAENGADHLKSPDHSTWLRRFAADHSNILSTLDYLIENKEVEGAFRLGGNIWLAWWRWGYLNQGRQWLNKILALQNDELENTLRARVLDGAAYLAMYQNDYRVAETYFEQSLKIWRENGTTKFLGRATSGLAGTYRTLGKYDLALQLNYECLKIFRQLGEEVSEADSLCNIAWQLMERGNYEHVLDMLEEALAIHSKNGYLTGLARTKIFLGDIHWRKNDPALAIRHLEEGITLLRQLNHRIQLPKGLYRLGLIYLCQGNLAQAEKMLVESVEISEEMYTKTDLTYSYSSLGLLRMAQNDLFEAETLFRQALNLRNEVGQPEGVLWAMEGLAVVFLKQEKYPQAQQTMKEAQVLRQAIFAPVLPHTIKFILQNWLHYNKKASNLPVEPVKTKALPSGNNGAIEAVPPVTQPLDNLPSSFGLDAAINLSKRENEVLKLIAQGYRTNQIARILSISPGTVNNHLSSIYSKLGVNSRTTAIRYALDRNML